MSGEQESSMERVVAKMPIDIYLEVLKHLGSPQTYQHSILDVQPDMNSLRNRTIRSMALVCREFYHHFFPYLFENIYVFADTQGGYTAAHCRRFCKSIVLGDQRARTLAVYVKTYAIVNLNVIQDKTEAGTVDECLSTYSKALAFMPNLWELHLFQSSVTNDLLRATHSLPPLKLLRFEDYKVPYPLDEFSLKQFAGLRVTTVYERGVLFGRDTGAGGPCRQLSRNFCLSHTEHLETDMHPAFLEELAGHSPMLHLQSLRISCLMVDDYRPILVDALKVMPNLKSLEIGCTDYYMDEGAPLALHTKFPPLEMLESIRAHLPALRAIVPRSPVSSISIAEENMPLEGPVWYDNDYTFWKPVAEAFNLSLRPIQQMDIPMNFYLKVSFAHHFPDLKLLTLRPKHINWYDEDSDDDIELDGQPDEIIATFLESWFDHPKLTDLEFTYAGRSSPLPIQEEQEGIVRYSICDVPDDTLATLRLRIPTLQYLRFVQDPPRFGGDESFEFCLGNQDKWRP